MMKALILAAGLGTRLRPYTEHTPKPLFSVDGQPLLDRLILQLRDSGCDAVAVNTHHLHEKIEAHIASQSYGLPVFTRHEPEILGTGGAIKNLSDFWNELPFLVVNADILTDIDFERVFDFHCRHNSPATLVLANSPPLNSVAVDSDGYISHFLSPSELARDTRKTYTFTGIQVLDPRILSLIPDNISFSSIDLYRRLIAENTPPLAYIETSCKWRDLGTLDRYQNAVRNEMAMAAFEDTFGRPPAHPIQWALLAGDGSDRIWYRVQYGKQSMVASDHGLKSMPGTFEVDSFLSIGRHLRERGLPVPVIYRYDLFSGLVFMEDLGDIHLQTVAGNENSSEALVALYQPVIDILIRLSTHGAEGFDPSWTYQSTAYDRELILERECAYFVDDFLNGFLRLDVSMEDFDHAFESLAKGALSGAFIGLMHRDFQSRNILVQHGKPRIIDFQGARIGPIQYDLASLLIDPYAGLTETIQEKLFGYTMARLSEIHRFDPEEFRRCYEYCRITRNLQMLGAFGYLSRIKGKRQFEQYIPAAARTLRRNLAILKRPELRVLKRTVDNLKI